MSDSFWHHGLCSPCNSPGQNTGVGSLSLLQGIFQSQESNPGPLHCKWIISNGFNITIHVRISIFVNNVNINSSLSSIEKLFFCIQSSPVQSLSRVQLFATPWITACQASLSITNSGSLLKPTSIKSVMPSNRLILCRPLLLLPQSLPASGSFPMSQLFAWGGRSTGVSASASVLPMNTQDWSPLGWTGWASLQSFWYSWS